MLFVAKLPKELHPLLLILLRLDTLWSTTVDYAHDSTSLGGLRDNDLKWVGGGGKESDDLGNRAEAVENVNWECILDEDDEGVAASDLLRVLLGQSNELIIISVGSDEAWTAGLAEGDTEFD